MPPLTGPNPFRAPRPHRARRWAWAGTLVALLAIGAGWTVAASFSVSLGSTETGAGTYHPTTALTYFAEVDAGVAIVPTPAPTTLSTTVGTPTVLPATATNYGVNTATAGDVGQFWKFTEATTAPVSTELVLRFSVSTGAGPTITQVTAYVETQAVAPGSALTFVLYFDLGAVSGGTITLNSVLEITQQCSAVGTCP